MGERATATAHGRTRRASRLWPSVGLLLALACVQAPAPPPAPLPPAPREPPACDRVARIEVWKEARLLVAECAGGRTLEFPVALGREPAGPKQRRGDARTPEGDYRIAGAVQTSRFHRFLPIDYPSAADAERALAQGAILHADYETIVAAHERGEMPPQQTSLGGHLGFHGEGPRWRGWLDLDWTQGCIALRDEDIERLAELAPPGTPVHILP